MGQCSLYVHSLFEFLMVLAVPRLWRQPLHTWLNVFPIMSVALWWVKCCWVNCSIIALAAGILWTNKGTVIIDIRIIIMAVMVEIMNWDRKQRRPWRYENDWFSMKTMLFIKFNNTTNHTFVFTFFYILSQPSSVKWGQQHWTIFAGIDPLHI